jgi:hypothetical protein
VGGEVRGATGGRGGHQPPDQPRVVISNGDGALCRSLRHRPSRARSTFVVPPQWTSVEDCLLVPYSLEGALASSIKMAAENDAAARVFDAAARVFDAAQRALHEAKAKRDYAAQNGRLSVEDHTAAWHKSSESWEQLDAQVWCGILKQLDDEDLHTADDFRSINLVSRFFHTKDLLVLRNFHGDVLDVPHLVNVVELAAYEIICSKSENERKKVENDDYGEALFHFIRQRLSPRFEYGAVAPAFEVQSLTGDRDVLRWKRFRFEAPEDHTGADDPQWRSAQVGPGMRAKNPGLYVVDIIAMQTVRQMCELMSERRLVFRVLFE